MSAAAAGPCRVLVEVPCPRCARRARLPVAEQQPAAAARRCPACGASFEPWQRQQLAGDGSLWGCLACGHDQMYWARDFPRALGIAVVIAAAALAPFTMYLSLAAGAALDAALVLVVPKRLHCYRCGAIHRRCAKAGEWRPFQLEVADLHRYGAKAAVARTLGERHAPPDGRRRAAPPAATG